MWCEMNNTMPEQISKWQQHRTSGLNEVWSVHTGEARFIRKRMNKLKITIPYSVACATRMYAYVSNCSKMLWFLQTHAWGLHYIQYILYICSIRKIYGDIEQQQTNCLPFENNYLFKVQQQEKKREQRFKTKNEARKCQEQIKSVRIFLSIIRHNSEHFLLH